ncbi:hypothetical protein EDD85DRAFT_178493 [Armillaria nabsnona]|nr:hypothetical protein EDD85DRAFT_178493 [Armillaria nabsnona]
MVSVSYGFRSWLHCAYQISSCLVTIWLAATTLRKSCASSAFIPPAYHLGLLARNLPRGKVPAIRLEQGTYTSGHTGKL